MQDDAIFFKADYRTVRVRLADIRYIVGLGRIREAGRDGVTLDDGTTLPVGDLYKQEFRDYLARTSLG